MTRLLNMLGRALKWDFGVGGEHLLTIEQPPALNRFVDDSIPLTWDYRWRALRPGLPLLVFCSFALVELVLFQSWLTDQFNPTQIPRFLCAALFPGLAIMLAFELRARFQPRSKRVLILKTKRVSFRPSRQPAMQWEQIRAFQFEPHQGKPQWTKITVEYALGRKGAVSGNWSLIVTKSEDRDALVSLLRSRQDAGPDRFEVRLLSKPATTVRHKAPSMVGIWLYSFGLYLFMHGFPLLCLAVPIKEEPPRSILRDEQVERKQANKLRRIIGSRFASARELRRFTLIVGGTVTAHALAFLMWGGVLMRRGNAANSSLASPSERTIL